MLTGEKARVESCRSTSRKRITVRGLTPVEFKVLSAAVSDIDTYFRGSEEHGAIEALYQRGLIRFEGCMNEPRARFVGTSLGALAYRLEVAVRRGTP